MPRKFTHVSVAKRLLDETAHALTQVLEKSNISYAICGGYWAITFGAPDRTTQGVDCIVEGGLSKTLEALVAISTFEIIEESSQGPKVIFYSSFCGRQIRIRLWKAGDVGPRKFQTGTTIIADHMRFLSPTEFLRAKVKAWVSRRANKDRDDILWSLCGLEGLDFERMNPGRGIDELAAEDEEVEEVWSKLKGLDVTQPEVATAMTESRDVK